MKTIFALSLFFAFQASAAPQSFDFLLTGLTAAGPHPNEDLYVRKLIAGFVENLKVKKYLQRPRPVNGGFQVCLTPIDDAAYNYILGELQTFAIRNSKWDPRIVRTCR